MSSSTVKTFLLAVVLCSFAFGQNVNLDTQVKGSRFPSWGTDSGAANAYVVTTIAPLGPTLRTGSSFFFSAANANTGSSTLNVDSTGAIAIKKMVSGSLANLSGGDIAPGQIHIFLYDGTQYQCVTCFTGGGGGSGTVTSIATSSPISGGTITTSGTLSCPTCVVASSPGAGIAHFAGSTQTVTSSPVSLTADVSGILPIANGGTNTSSPGLVAGSNINITGTWPNQTVNATSSGGGTTIIGATPFATPVLASSAIPYNGMSLWLSADCIYLSDGSTCSTPANGTSITVWDDRSGIWLNALNTTTACTFATNVINGEPAVSFNGTCGKYVLNPTTFAGLFNNWRDSITIFAVAKAAVTNQNMAMVGGTPGTSGPGTGTEGIEYRIPGSEKSKEQQLNNTFTADMGNGTATVDTNWHQFNVQCATASYMAASVQPTFRLDRAADATISGANCSNYDANTAITQLNLVGWAGISAGDVFNGSIAEIIVYQRLLSSTEITAVESYLHTKYGL